MKNAIEFTSSINYDNFEESITKFFDETMYIYKVIGKYSNILNINGNVDDSSISFLVEFMNNEDTIKYYNAINESIHEIFGRTFRIETELNTCNILIKFL